MKVFATQAKVRTRISSIRSRLFDSLETSAFGLSPREKSSGISIGKASNLIKDRFYMELNDAPGNRPAEWPVNEHELSALIDKAHQEVNIKIADGFLRYREIHSTRILTDV